MRIQRCWFVVAVLLIPAAAGAHDHTADFFGAPSFAKESSIWGFHQGLAVTLPTLDHDLAVLGDFSLHVGKHKGNDLTQIAFMGGLRLTFPGQVSHRNLFSVHGLVGGVHSHEGAQDDTDWAAALGAGYEFLPKGLTSAAGLAFRVQGDYVIREGGGFPRLSAGIAFRFKRLPKP